MKINNLDKELILYVDDEKEHLDSFNILFRKEYDVKVAESAELGMQIMKEQEVKLVITDQRMPKMQGVEFLEKIASLYPDVPRVILTGYSDEEAIIAAINKGRVFRYITKPWKKEELKDTINFALESYRLKIENQELIENLKKINNELDEFVYRASHDLRAPLASVLGLINLAKKETDIKVIQEYISLKERSVLKLDALIKDIVEFSKNAHLEIRNEKVNLEALINNSLDLHRFFEHSQQVTKNIKVNGASEFHSDEFRVEIILNNLISNAIRYADLEKESPTINIDIQTDKKSCVISIYDNGIGIENEHLDKIFEMFHRGIDQNTGSGLGLFIVKETVEKLKGKIDVQSKPGDGTKFIVKIPNLVH